MAQAAATPKPVSSTVLGSGVAVETSLVVMVSDQPPENEPLSPAESSVTNNCQVPFGLIPPKVLRSVAVPQGPGLEPEAGAGEGRLSWQTLLSVRSVGR